MEREPAPGVDTANVPALRSATAAPTASPPALPRNRLRVRVRATLTGISWIESGASASDRPGVRGGFCRPIDVPLSPSTANGLSGYTDTSSQALLTGVRPVDLNLR